jgi:hypothetical protein
LKLWIKPPRVVPEFICNQEHYNKNVDHSDHPSLTSYLIQYYGENSSCIKILKLCHQAIVISFLGNLGESLFYTNGIRFKDNRGTWEIIIKKHNGNNRNDKLPFISVTHKRSETALLVVDNKRITQLYSFTWEVRIEFDSLKFNHINNIDANVLSIDWSSCDKTFSESLNDEKKSTYVKFNFNN